MSDLANNSTGVEAEIACLASAVLNLDALDRVVSQLTPEYFETQRHQVIFAAMRGLKTTGQPVNRLTLRRQLEIDRTLAIAGGVEYLAQITEFFPVVENIRAYITLVIESWRRRKALGLSLELSRHLSDPGCDAAGLATEYAARLVEVGHEEELDQRHWHHKALDREERLLDLSATENRVGWPLDALTRRIKAFQRDQLIVIAGLYSHGKTWLGLQAAHYAARHRKPTKFYSYEMETARVGARLNWFQTGINPDNVNDSNRGEWNAGYAEGAKLPLWIEDREDLADFDRVVADMELSIRKHRIELFIFDYLRLMRRRGCKSLVESIPAISMAMKVLVKRYGVDIVLLHQINKSTEKDKRSPRLSDCEFGGHTDCDIGIVVNQPGRYLSESDFKGPNAKAEYERRVPEPLYTEISVEKNRNGSCGVIQATFDQRNGVFMPYVPPKQGVLA